MARRRRGLRGIFGGLGQGATHGSNRRRRLSRPEQLEPRLFLNADSGQAVEDDTADSALDPVNIGQLAVTPVQPVVGGTGDSFLPGIAIDYYYPFPREIEYASSPRIEPPDTAFQSIDDVRAWLTEHADTHFGDLFGTTYTREYPGKIYPWPIFDFDFIGFDDSFDVVPFDLAMTNSVGGDFSETNVQVEGVDEADLLETDGNYLYFVSQGELLIIDAADSQNLSIASRVRLDDSPTGMYLSGDRLTLVSSAYGRFGGQFSSAYGQYGGQSTTVTVLDVSDQAAPSLVQKTELDGTMISSRMVDGELRLVLQHRGAHWPQYLPPLQARLVEETEAGTAKYVYETREEYLARMEQETISTMFPGYRSYSLEGEVIESDLWLPAPVPIGPEAFPLPSQTTVVTFDVHADEPGPADWHTFSSSGATTVYATEESLYVFGQAAGQNYYAETTVWKFDFDQADHSIEQVAQGSFAGTLLNQFAADEHDGYLRVVTTNSWGSAGQSLLVLEQVGQELQIVGSVDGLAPRERLHSVRFMGERAFLVTFRKVDPLFAVDLSDPANPTVEGELKIPGYSDYLQPIDENHLLGIGRGADESIGLFQELQISIFDVSDLSDPQLAHRYSFDGGRSTASITTGGRWTQGDGEHHAVSYFGEEQILAIPIYSADQGSGIWAGVDNTAILEAGKGALAVFSVDVGAGFEPLATIEHDSQILRSLRIGEALFVVSGGEISTHDLSDPATELDNLELLVGADAGLVKLTAYVAPPSAADVQAVTYHVSRDLSPLSPRVERAAARADEENAARRPVRERAASSRLDDVRDLTPRHARSRDLAESRDLAFTSIGSAGNRWAARPHLDEALLDDVASELLGELASEIESTDGRLRSAFRRR